MSNEINGDVTNLSIISGKLSDEELYLLANPDAPWAGMSLDFQALNNEADVQIGVGGLTTVWNSGGYAWTESKSIYEPVAPNTPVWNGSELLYYPEATNGLLHSNNLTVAPWGNYNFAPIILKQDAVGLIGGANTATRLRGDGVNDKGRQNSFSILADTTVYTSKFWVGKGQGELKLRQGMIGGTAVTTYTTINLSDGTLSNTAGAGSVDVTSVGNWWLVLISEANNSTNTIIRVIILDPDGVADKIIGEVEILPDKTIPEVRALPPIFTEGAAVTMDRTDYSFDIANHDDDNGIWVCDWKPSYADTEQLVHSGIISTTSGAENILYDHAGAGSIYSYDGTTPAILLTSWGADDVSNLSVTYHAGDAQMQISNNTASGEAPYDGTYISDGSSIRIHKDQTITASMKNLRRYSITSYAQGKAFVYKNFPTL